MTSTLDLRAQPFGKWLVIRKGQQTVHGQFWLCQCACNLAITVELLEAALVEGWTQSCGCDYTEVRRDHRPIVNLVGRQVGDRLVLGLLPRGRKGTRYWCRCQCGKEHAIYGLVLARGSSGRCMSCAKTKRLNVRWYNDCFVTGSAGKGADGHLLYECQFQDGTTHVVRATDLRRKVVKGCGVDARWGSLTGQEDAIMALLAAGVSRRGIARAMGVNPTAVRQFLDKRTYLQSLVASLSPDEELIGGGSDGGGDTGSTGQAGA